MPALGWTQPLLFVCPKFWPGLLGLAAVSYPALLLSGIGCGVTDTPVDTVQDPAPEHSSESRPGFPQGQCLTPAGSQDGTCL